MNKLLLSALLLFTAGAVAKDAVNLDIWNKTNQPLYFELGTVDVPPTGRRLVELQASNAKNASVSDRILSGLKFGASSALNLDVKGDFAQTNINNKEKTLILLSRTKDVKPGSKVVLVTVSPNKDIYLRLKDDAKGQELFAGDKVKYIFGPQTGPLGGWAGRTEHGLSLSNIAKQADIQINPNYVIPAYKPAQGPLSDKEKDFIKAAGGNDNAEEKLSPENQRLVDSLKGIKDHGLDLD